ncbi:olfactory receptor 13D1-like [Pleurodeles waltl]|uniref:olfactory receptor 13D1-like n=1 Tax=Pleurodeles waltl TaxID=8319 RepID=UPI003709A9A6
MEKWNGSSVTEFLLLGLSEDPNIQVVLFMLFLVIYLVTIMGNLFLITVCVRDPRLHTPMYFFLANLSFIDICYSSVIVPNLLNQLIISKIMSFSRCAVQMYSHLLVGCTESMVLAVMAYDRYIAISFPLRYTSIINSLVCVVLMAVCWLIGSVMALLITVFALKLPLCGNNVIDHFFCEVMTFLKMACGDTFIALTMFFVVGTFVLLTPSLFILFSYIRIVITIMGIRSSEGRSKAFSTCASHLIVVTMAYGTAIFMHMKPVSKNVDNQQKMVSVFYTVMPAMMHPMIYSLRNKDVKMAVHRVIWKNIHH